MPARGEEATLGHRTVTLGSLCGGGGLRPISCLCETKICLREVASKAVSSTVHPSVWLIKKRCLPSVRLRPPSVPCQATLPPSVSYSRLTLVSPPPHLAFYLPGGSALALRPSHSSWDGRSSLRARLFPRQRDPQALSQTQQQACPPPQLSSSPRWLSPSLSRHHLTHNSLAAVPSLFRLSSCSQI